jgi:polysaccharide pyruvyl transferase WcaK-like protein
MSLPFALLFSVSIPSSASRDIYFTLTSFSLGTTHNIHVAFFFQSLLQELSQQILREEESGREMVDLFKLAGTSGSEQKDKTRLFVHL